MPFFFFLPNRHWSDKSIITIRSVFDINSAGFTEIRNNRTKYLEIPTRNNRQIVRLGSAYENTYVYTRESIYIA